MSAIWYEVWPAGWGFYYINRCGGNVLGVPIGPSRAATVFGRKRAIARARSLQRPVFNTLDDRRGEAAREAPPKSVDLREGS